MSCTISLIMQDLILSLVTWSLNEKELRETDNVKIDRKPVQATLTLKNVKLVNSGEYFVTAANHYGSKSASCRVQVLGRSVAQSLQKHASTFSFIVWCLDI